MVRKCRENYIRNQWHYLMPLIIIASAFLGYLFFNSFFMSGLISSGCIFLVKPMKKMAARNFLKRSEMEFMLFIYSLSSMLSVGKSFESAFKQSLTDMKEESVFIILGDDLEKVNACFDLNMSIEDSLVYLNDKYPVESISNFTKILQVAIQKGSSLEQITQMTISAIRDKNEVDKELDVIITQKRYELVMMMAFVPLMILYLRVVSSGFTETMYGTLTGRVVMILCLLLYGLSAYIGNQIIQVDI